MEQFLQKLDIWSKKIFLHIDPEFQIDVSNTFLNIPKLN